MEKAYLISKNHFDVQEVNYQQLKDYTNNIILEHVNVSGSEYFYFKRSLFELDRLDFNVGILLDSSNILSEDQIINNLLWNIKGFDIKLGIWIKGPLKESIYDKLHKEFSNNFIVGMVSENDKISSPRWGTMGDIEELENISLDFIKDPITEIALNVDYKTIYEKNNLKPIPSTYK